MAASWKQRSCLEEATHASPIGCNFHHLSSAHEAEVELGEALLLSHSQQLSRKRCLINYLVHKGNKMEHHRNALQAIGPLRTRLVRIGRDRTDARGPRSHLPAVGQPYSEAPKERS